MERKLGRKSANRNHLTRNLVTSLIIYERIKTTEAKAKAIRPVIDRIISYGKKGDLASRRRILGYVFDNNAAKKIFEVIAPRYQHRSGGYTRIFHFGSRKGDAAPMVILELIPETQTAKPKEEKETKETAEKQAKKETPASDKNAKK